LLNPRFGQTSDFVGGADIDLIAGDSLVDFKTTKQDAVEVGSVDQMLGYLLLARKQQTIDPTFPVINQLSFYFSRHGYLWSMPASNWTSRPEFAELEQWFFQRAAEVYSDASVAGKRIRRTLQRRGRVIPEPIHPAPTRVP
jgi:hypothetical protein